MSSTDRPAEIPPSTAESVVLIVEDTDDLRNLFAEELRAAGFRVIQASDGQSAIEKARRHAPQAIVLDLMLPELNGFSVARFVRQDFRTHDAIIIAITALTSEGLRLTALEAGCDLFIRKPVVASEVVGELGRLLERRRVSRSEAPAQSSHG